jgi:hypothetical protein
LASASLLEYSKLLFFREWSCKLLSNPQREGSGFDLDLAPLEKLANVLRALPTLCCGTQSGFSAETRPACLNLTTAALQHLNPYPANVENMVSS